MYVELHVKGESLHGDMQLRQHMSVGQTAIRICMFVVCMSVHPLRLQLLFVVL